MLILFIKRYAIFGAENVKRLMYQDIFLYRIGFIDKKSEI